MPRPAKQSRYYGANANSEPSEQSNSSFDSTIVADFSSASFIRGMRARCTSTQPGFTPADRRDSGPVSLTHAFNALQLLDRGNDAHRGVKPVYVAFLI